MNYSDYLISGYAPVYVTSAYTAKPRDLVMVASDVGAITVTLPASPSTGTMVSVADAGQNAETNNITVARNGSTILGLSEDFILDVDSGRVDLVYNGTTWKLAIFATGGSVTDADAVHLSVANELAGLTEKTTPAAADKLLLEDSAAGYAKKWATIKNSMVNAANQTFRSQFHVVGLLNDDASDFIDLSAYSMSNLGSAIVTTNVTGEYAIVGFRAQSSQFCFSISKSTDFEVTTGALTGTTGTDTKSTISVDSSGNFWVECRRGSQRNYYINIAA